MERKSQKIYEVYLESFKEKFSKFKQNHSDHLRLEGKLVEHYEYPIGQDDKLQYYQAYGLMTLMSTHRHRDYTRNELAGLLEGYSTNEGAKCTKSAKHRRQRARSEAPRKRKPK